MTIDTDRILAELYQIDPTLKKHEEVLRRVIPVIADAKPHVVVDDAFMLRLRQELMHAHAERAVSSVRSPYAFFFAHGFALPTLITLFVMGGTIMLHGNGAMKLAITTDSARAFGTLTPASPVSTGGKNAASAAVGLGGGTGMGLATSLSSLGTAYTYDGGTFTIPATGYVYKRVVDASTGSRLISALGGMRSGIALNSFSNLNVRNIDVAEDTDYGYTINLNLPQGTASINANWERWHMDKRQGSVLVSDMPSDKEIIAIADQFLAQHHISTASYGAPVIDQGWREMPRVMTLDGQPLPAYAPDTLMLTYPLMLDGLPVYESWGAPSGIQVLIDTRNKRVSGVNNIDTLTFDRSAYALETDADMITAIATARDANQKTSSEVLTSPQLVLMKYQHDSEELIVPAMRFPVREHAEGSVLVPLVKDIADALAPKNTEQITVQLGKTGSANGITITPTEVLEDSRCPMGMMCIQTGTVRVQTTLGSGLGSGSAPQIFTLFAPITTETEIVTLSQVLPLRKAGATIPPSEYQFVFDIQKR